jgi:hypothetical protein
VLSIAQAAIKRGRSGQPLPGMWAPLAARDVSINRSELSLFVGPPSAGKSLLMMNYMVRAQVPTLAFFLDSDNLTVAARFGAILTGDTFKEVKEDIDLYTGALERMEDTQVVFRAEDFDDIKLQGEAFEQRYGAYPSLVIIDNLGNLTSALGDEWALLKALTLELNNLAHEWECAIVAAHHMTDLVSCEPLQRDKLLGKVSQYPRLILSIGFNDVNGDYKIAAVKNSSGPSDPGARNPVTMYADPSRMMLAEERPWTPSSSLTANESGGYQIASGGWSAL